MQRNKIFSFDLDRTLLNDQNILSQNTINIISSIPNNHLVIINTGRSLKSSISLAKKLILNHVNGYLVASNGGLIYSMFENKIICANYIEEEIKNKLIDYAINNNFVLYLNSNDYIWTNELTRSIEFWSLSGEVEIKMFKNKNDVKETITGGVFTYIKNKNIPIEKHYQILETKFPNMHFHHYVNGVSDFTNNFFNKGLAIKWLADYKGFNMKYSYAFGDSYNDLDMFEYTQHKIAVENAIDELKAKSTKICLSNNEDGPAIFVKKILGI